MKNVPEPRDSKRDEVVYNQHEMRNEYLERLLEFGRSFSDRAASQLRLTPRHSGPDHRPGRVSDIWALSGGVLLIALSGLGAFLFEKAC